MTGRVVHVEEVMGTAVTFDVRATEDPTPAIRDAASRLHQIDETYSTHRAASVVSRIAAGTLEEGASSCEVQEVLAACRALEDATAGAFDLHATDRLDPSGYVKGWAVDRAAETLVAAGLSDFMVNAGGDVAVHGDAADDHDGWHIGIVNPHDRTTLIAVAQLHGGAIATSGRYERGDHVPAVPGGEPVESVSVVAADLAVADAWATAILAGGLPTLRLAGRGPGLELLVVSGDQVLTTPRFPSSRAHLPRRC